MSKEKSKKGKKDSKYKDDQKMSHQETVVNMEEASALVHEESSNLPVNSISVGETFVETTEMPTESPTQPPLTNEELIMLRKLMNAICGCHNTQEATTGADGERIVYKDKIVEKEVVKYVDKIIEKEVIKTVEVEKIIEKLPDSVNPMLDIISIVKNDEELNRQWLDNIHDQGKQLIKMTAILSQWDQVDRLWDKLASRCKNDKRPPTPQERQLLEKAVETYNLTLNSRQASLATGELGGSYDYEKQQRGLPTGDKVVAEWLPALVNAAGTVVKKTLVETR